MAFSEPQRRTFVRIASLGHLAIAAWCVLASVRQSGLPSHYYQFRHGEAGFVYPAHEVGVWCSAIAAELVATCWILWFVRATASTAALLAVLFGVATCGFGVVAMHAPPYYGMHVVFLLFSAAWLVIVALAAALLGASLGKGEREAERLKAAVAARPDDSL
jgi:hypothetical protein